jgi:hypothetical protein
MTDQQNRADWLKTGISIASFVLVAMVQVIGLVFWFSTTLTKFEGKVELINQNMGNISSSVADFKSDVKSSVSGIRGDIKEVSAFGMKVTENSLEIGAIKKRLDLVEENKRIHVDPPMKER